MLHRRDEVFEVGDWVPIKLHPFWQQSLAKRLNFKLAKRFFGPFQVREKVGSVSYLLDLPEGSRIHPVFHTSLLRRFVGPPPDSPSPLPPDVPASLPTPVAVHGHRVLSENGFDVTQLLVQWSGETIEDATWVAQADVARYFPHVGLEGKASLVGGGDDTGQTCGAEQLGPIVEDTGPSVRTTGTRTKRLPVWTKDFVLGKPAAK